MTDQQKRDDTKSARRDLLWAFIALIVFVAICLAVLVAHNPTSRRSANADGLALTVLHTNDTLGYLTGCG